jgi:hypothetical protein
MQGKLGKFLPAITIAAKRLFFSLTGKNIYGTKERKGNRQRNYYSFGAFTPHLSAYLSTGSSWVQAETFNAAQRGGQKRGLSWSQFCQHLSSPVLFWLRSTLV